MGDAAEAHKCNGCGKNIHAICGHEVVVDGEALEGYGAPRTCSPCFERPKLTNEAEESVIELEEEETPSKSSKYSKYFSTYIKDGIKYATCTIKDENGKRRREK